MELFDNVSSSYFTNSSTQKSAGSRLIEISKINTSDHVLDIGCGSGNITSDIANVSASVVAIDHSEQTINFAKTNNSHPSIK
tara:strand:- start:5291 stop:5536 length:246 start_codon:yes stop_codon:yes gene_type:complete